MSYIDSLFSQDKKPQVQISCSIAESERDALDALLKRYGEVPRTQFVAACVRDGIEQLKKLGDPKEGGPK